MRNIILICVSLLLTCPCIARTITVDDDGPADFNNIQTAINNADDGDTVFVKDGTYTGEGNHDIRFRGKAITVRSENGPENCVIDCEALGRGFYFKNGEDSSSVLDGLTIINGYESDFYPHYSGGVGIFCNSDSNPTIINCVFSNNLSPYGGVISCTDGSNPMISDCIFKNNMSEFSSGIICYESSPTITNCTFSNNSSYSHDGAIGCEDGSNPAIINCTISDNEGGGIYVYHHSSPTIRNCVLSGNSAGTGGGIYLGDASSAVITECDFIENSAIDGGGGIFCSRSTITVSNCRFIGNSSLGNEILPGDGGSILFHTCSSTVRNCVFIDNYAEEMGGGIMNYRASPTITNCTFAGNKADISGGAFFNRRDSFPKISNCILWSNESPSGHEVYNHDNCHPTFSYCDVQGGLISPSIVNEDGSSVVDSGGNINTAPLFVDPVGDDYHLLINSPCIDTGDPNYMLEPNETDLDGNPRILNGRIDMGAYEYVPLVEVEIQLTPQMLNCDSHGNWLKAHIVMPEEIYPEDIDVNTPAIANPPGVESEYIEVFDNGKGHFDVQIYFDRQSFCEALSESEDGSLEVTVTGSLLDGRKFQGSDTIKLKSKSRHHRIQKLKPIINNR